MTGEAHGHAAPRDERIHAAIVEYLAAADGRLLDHHLQVTSFGGVGTTAVCDHLAAGGADLPKGPDHWPYKHARTRPAADELPEGFAAIYVLGDPRNAVLSLFRRSLAWSHYRLLHLRTPPAEIEPALADLEAFVAGGIDHFDLADHVDRWLAPNPPFPLMVVRYETMAESWPRIAAFAGIASGEGLEVRPRRSDWRAQPAPIRDGLDVMLGALARRIEDLPPVIEL